MRILTVLMAMVLVTGMASGCCGMKHNDGKGGSCCATKEAPAKTGNGGNLN